MQRCILNFSENDSVHSISHTYWTTEPLFTEHGVTMAALFSGPREVVSWSENSKGRLVAAVAMQPSHAVTQQASLTVCCRVVPKPP